MILPKTNKQGKPLLSYTQINSFLNNKRDYIKQYFLGAPIEFTAYIDFGAKVGKALETADFSEFEQEEQSVLSSIPRYDEFEKEVRVDFGDFEVIGYIDTIRKDYSKLLDYKTGTEKKISEYTKPDYIQPILYALGIEQETGYLPKEAGVVLIERLGNPFKGEQLKLGKTFWEIPLEVSTERINFAKDLTRKVAEDISRYYEVFLKLNKII